MESTPSRDMQIWEVRENLVRASDPMMSFRPIAAMEVTLPVLLPPSMVAT
jgi:hypothetical protein